jgi:hypothetical protein
LGKAIADDAVAFFLPVFSSFIKRAADKVLCCCPLDKGADTNREGKGRCC